MSPGDADSRLPADRPTSVRWLIAILGCTASWVLYLHRYAWGVIKPDLKRDYPELSAIQLGWLDSAFLLTYGLGQIPSGYLGDRYGPRLTLGLMILVWSIMVAAFGWVQGTVALIAVRAVFGLAQAGAYPVLAQVTRRWFPITSRTTIQGAVAALGRLGGACASLLIATWLIGMLGLGWRESLVWLALPGVALAVAVLVIFRDTPAQHPWCNAAERELIAEGSPATTTGRRPVLQMTGPAVFALLCLMFYSFVSTFADQLYVYWIPLFLEEGKGLTKSQMGVFAMLPLLGGALGSIVGGILNDFLIRRLRPRLARSFVAFAGKGLAAVLIAVSVSIPDGRMVMVVLFLCKFFNDLSMPTLWGAITDVAGPASGTVFGIVNTCGTVGGFLAGPIMGWLRIETGWEGLFYVVAGVYLAGALTWVFLNCERRLVVDSQS